MRRALGLAASLAVAAVLTLSVVPAAVGAAAQAAPLRDLRVGPTGLAYSSNWSGYADTQSLTYNKVKGSWTQPSVTCPASNAIAAFWVGLDGYNSTTVEQDGTIAICSGGTPSYYDWWEMYPTNSVQLVKPISPGDKLSSSVTYAAGKYTLKVTDSTHSSASFTTKQACGSGLTCSRNSSEWIIERPSSGTSLYPLADFGTLKMTKADSATTAGYQPINTWTNTAIDMCHVTGTSCAYTLDTTTPTSGATTSFTETWKAAS